MPEPLAGMWDLERHLKDCPGRVLLQEASTEVSGSK